jgi:hypothetical protein
MITTHIDGSGQTVFFDDITYAIGIAPPTLTISKTSLADVFLQWPTNYVGFALESTLSLSVPIAWSSITNEVSISGEKFGVRINSVEAAQFFRLRKP